MAAITGKRFRRPSHWTLAQTLEHYSVTGPHGCRLWTGAKSELGYAVLHWNGSRQLVSRLVLEDAMGAIPAGIKACHSCDNPPCIELSHLFPGTQAANIADMVQKGRQARGSRCRHAKLTDATAMSVFQAKGQYEAIGAQYGVSVATVCMIKNKSRWAHIHLP